MRFEAHTAVIVCSTKAVDVQVSVARGSVAVIVCSTTPVEVHVFVSRGSVVVVIMKLVVVVCGSVVVMYRLIVSRCALYAVTVRYQVKNIVCLEISPGKVVVETATGPGRKEVVVTMTDLTAGPTQSQAGSSIIMPGVPETAERV